MGRENSFVPDLRDGSYLVSFIITKKVMKCVILYSEVFTLKQDSVIIFVTKMVMTIGQGNNWVWECKYYIRMKLQGNSFVLTTRKSGDILSKLKRNS